MTEREIVKQGIRDRNALVRTGVGTGAKLIARAIGTYLRDWQAGKRPTFAVEGLLELVVTAMTAAHLNGSWRTRQRVPKVRLSLSYEHAVKVMQQRAGMSEETVARITREYSREAATVVPKLTAHANEQLQKRMVDITQKGMHVRQGVKELRNEFQLLGLTPRNNYALEAIFRTQTNAAYTAGRWQQEQDPDIQQILWGYKYVTVGDDRVRDDHAAMDGTTLPKDDPFWLANTPPNGWGCRCDIISIFDEGTPVPPKQIDGRAPTADKGFAFHPGRLFEPIKIEIVPPPRSTTKIVRPPTTPKPKPSEGWGAGQEFPEMQVAIERDFGMRISSARLSRETVEDAMRVCGDVAQDLKARLPAVQEAFASKRIQTLEMLDAHPQSRQIKGAWEWWDKRVVVMPEQHTIARSAALPEVGIKNFRVDTSMAGTFRHEVGHAMTQEYSPGGPWAKLYESKSRSYWSKHVSEYGAANSQELAAESFSAWTHPGYGKLAKRLPKEIEELLTKTVGKPKGLVLDTPKKVPVPTPKATLEGTKDALAQKYHFDTWDSELPAGKRLDAVRRVEHTFDDLVERFPQVGERVKQRHIWNVDLVQKKFTKEGKELLGTWNSSDRRMTLAVKGRPLTASTGRPSIGSWHSGNRLADTLRHELGHALEQTRYLEWSKLYRSQPQEYWSSKVSHYAASSHRELAAESFSYYTHPNYAKLGKRLPKAVEDLLEKTVGKIKGLEPEVPV